MYSATIRILIIVLLNLISHGIHNTNTQVRSMSIIKGYAMSEVHGMQ